MPHEPKSKKKTTLSEWMTGQETFPGFAPPTSNTTYTPNQFFDVCLPHYSRGVVRLVAYLIRKTLGWCDAGGNPQEEQIQVSYHDLIDRAGISREMIPEAIHEAMAGGFIGCRREGRPSRFNQTGTSSLFQLRWDGSSDYVKNPEKFNGFFEGEGNRTDIPNQFFDWVIPREPLSVIKVVGSIARFSIGFQAHHGRRRTQVALSYKEIQNYARIADPTSLSSAIQHALESNYTFRLERGCFDPNAGKLSKAAVYCLRWADSFASRQTGQKTLAGPNQSENQSGSGQKTLAANQSENQSGIQMKQTNETSKQQQGSADAERAKDLLSAEGFDGKTAKRLASSHSLEQIRNQIDWLKERAPRRNKLGMLRKAIEENWPRPEKLGISQVFQTSGTVFASAYYAGFAGNRGEPVAEPSSRETEAGDKYVERLLGTSHDVPQIQE